MKNHRFWYYRVFRIPGTRLDNCELRFTQFTEFNKSNAGELIETGKHDKQVYCWFPRVAHLKDQKTQHQNIGKNIQAWQVMSR